MGKLRFRLRRIRMQFRNGTCFSILFGVLFACLIIAYLSSLYEPVLEQIALTQTQNAVSNAINDSVSQEISDDKVTYDSLITLEKNESGQVTALQSNMAAINTLRTDLLKAALNSTNGLISQEMSVPVGSLTHFPFFSGRGPSITFKLVSVGAATAKIDNLFTDAGVNQTRHQIMLTITTQISILLPGHIITTTEDTSICVAETVIVGTVPNTFLQMDTSK
jgi:sporulation protein YunB